jgi:hypothetical protein
VKCNEALPQAVPAAGLIILRDGEPGEPDITLNPIHFYYNHRAEIEAFVPQPSSGGGEARLDVLPGDIGTALAAERSLGGLAETLTWSAQEISRARASACSDDCRRQIRQDARAALPRARYLWLRQSRR